MRVKKDFKTLNRKFVAGEVIVSEDVDNVEFWISRGFVEADAVSGQEAPGVGSKALVQDQAPADAGDTADASVRRAR